MKKISMWGPIALCFVVGGIYIVKPEIIGKTALITIFLAALGFMALNITGVLRKIFGK